MDKREKVIGHLGILRTWCAVNPKYGMALSVEDCDKAVGWLDDAIAMLKAPEPRVMTLEEVKQHNNQDAYGLNSQHTMQMRHLSSKMIL